LTIEPTETAPAGTMMANGSMKVCRQPPSSGGSGHLGAFLLLERTLAT
jgi:hypothetical protein